MRLTTTRRSLQTEMLMPPPLSVSCFVPQRSLSAGFCVRLSLFCNCLFSGRGGGRGDGKPTPATEDSDGVDRADAVAVDRAEAVDLPEVVDCPEDRADDEVVPRNDATYPRRTRRMSHSSCTRTPLHRNRKRLMASMRFVISTFSAIDATLSNRTLFTRLNTVPALPTMSAFFLVETEKREKRDKGKNRASCQCRATGRRRSSTTARGARTHTRCCRGTCR